MKSSQKLSSARLRACSRKCRNKIQSLVVPAHIGHLSSITPFALSGHYVDETPSKDVTLHWVKNVFRCQGSEFGALRSSNRMENPEKAPGRGTIQTIVLPTAAKMGEHVSLGEAFNFIPTCKFHSLSSVGSKQFTTSKFGLTRFFFRTVSALALWILTPANQTLSLNPKH